MYCNSVYGGIYNPEVGAKVNTYYQIKNYKGKDISDTLVIPYQAKINGEMYRITEVNLLVYGCQSPSVLWDREGYELPNVNTIIYPNTVKKIFTTSNNVYSDNYTIQNVILSESLSEIGTDAFIRISKLKNITLPNSVTSIGSKAFYGSGLTSITIPDNVTRIENDVFYSCFKLTSITIPNSVTNIGNYAFRYCYGLKTVNYKGTQEEWNKITIGTGNESLTNATINYNYKGN